MISLRRLAIPVALLLTGASVTSCKAAVPPDAQPAAESWLSLVDNGRYSDSWSEAAEVFKKAVDSPSWGKQVGGVRSPLGALKTRTKKSATAASSLPGAPDGAYVVFQFDASYERKAAAVETVTVSKEADSRWKVAGYFIK